MKRSSLWLMGVAFFIFFMFFHTPFIEADDSIQSSYHGQLGRSPAIGGWGNGLGMLEKWCALPNFSFEKDGGEKGWKKRCGKCHVSSYKDPATGKTDCTLCHATKDGKGSPKISQCIKCHVKDTAKRGDIFNEEHDVHIAMDMKCQDCHERLSDAHSDHQFAKGSVIDTTEDTMKGTLSCMKCHEERPHGSVKGGEILDERHVSKIACVTCHTGKRPGKSLKSRDWTKFTKKGKPVTKKRQPGWIPGHKWYTGEKIGHLPILGSTQLMSKIYPFNTVQVKWFIVGPDASFDDVVPIRDVKAADADKDGETVVEEMQRYRGGKYKNATVVTKEFNFNVTHSIKPAEKAFGCFECHGKDGYVLNWKELGYVADPLK